MGASFKYTCKKNNRDDSAMLIFNKTNYFETDAGD